MNTCMTQSKHTPTPWDFCKDEDCGPCGNIYGRHHEAKPVFIGQAFGPEHEKLYQLDNIRFCQPKEQIANAAHIVRCVNSHDGLVDAVVSLMLHLIELQNAGYGCCADNPAYTKAAKIIAKVKGVA